MLKCSVISFVYIPTPLSMFWLLYIAVSLCGMNPFSGEISTLFCSEVSNLDPSQVKVVPLVDVSAQHLDPLGVHNDNVVHQFVVDRLLASFKDGIFVDPALYPLDAIGYFAPLVFLILWFSSLVRKVK